MFKSWSIKRLLKGWSILTLVAMICVSLMAGYTNSLYSSSEDTIIRTVVPLENANRNMTSIIASLFTLQSEARLSNEKNDALHFELEQKFEHYLDTISSFLNQEKDNKASSSILKRHYEQFIELDKSFLTILEQSKHVHTNLVTHTKRADEIGEAIDLNSQRLLYLFTQSLDDIKYTPTIIRDSLVMKSDYVIDQNTAYMGRELSRELRLGVLKLLGLTQLIIRAKNNEQLSEINIDDIKNIQLVIDSQLIELKLKVGSLFPNNDIINAIESNISELLVLVIDDKTTSILDLKKLIFNYEKQLLFLEKESLRILLLIMDMLETLSTEIDQKNLTLISQAIDKAEKYAWVTFIIVMVIMLGIAQFILLMSGWITKPLEALREAMYGLSSKQFYTRINENFGKSEFSLLAKDFNTFAENNQKLIRDLAQAKDSLQSREQHISAILNGVPEVILTISSSGQILSTNIEAERVLNVDKDTLLTLNLIQFFAPEEHIDDMTDVINLLEISKEFVGIDYLGNHFSMWLSLNALDKAGERIWICVISDISAQKKAELAFKKSSIELDTILENAMVGIAFIFDRIFMRVNHKFEQLFACERETIQGELTRCIYPTYEQYLQIGEQAYQVLEQGESYSTQVELVRQNGEKFWCSISCKAIDSSQPYDGSIWLFEDITQQRINDERLRRLANFDILTELPNRAVFNDRLTHSVNQARRRSGQLAVLFLDLDHFKHINDSLGHKAGDLLLTQVAARLQECVREEDTVARLGGDEFTVILENIRSAQYAAKVAEKIAYSVSEPYNIESTEVAISTSIGISLYPTDGVESDSLIKNADSAMYYAKKKGRNTFEFYSKEMNSQAAERLEMEVALRRAVTQNEFSLNFQPQIDLNTNTIVGAEALLRWTSQQWGDVSPAVFVPILEDIGLIANVGEHVLRQACEAYLSMKDRLRPEFKIAVNLSGRQFHGGQLAVFVEYVLNELGMPASNLELEITESILMDDADLAINTMNQLSNIGVTLAMDDFGTGYSSLSYLKRFPLDVLKIDRSFVQDVTVDTDDAAIVDAILAMCRRLDLDVVAEGVETQEQLDFLIKNQCNRIQGYFISKPLTLDKFSDFIDNYNQR